MSENGPKKCKNVRFLFGIKMPTSRKLSHLLPGHLDFNELSRILKFRLFLRDLDIQYIIYLLIHPGNFLTF